MMKVVVINSYLKDKHRDMIRKAVASAGGKVFFTESEDDIPEEFAGPDGDQLGFPYDWTQSRMYLCSFYFASSLPN